MAKALNKKFPDNTWKEKETGPTLGEHFLYAFDDPPDYNGLDVKEFDQGFDWAIAGTLSSWVFLNIRFARG